MTSCNHHRGIIALDEHAGHSKRRFDRVPTGDDSEPRRHAISEAYSPGRPAAKQERLCGTSSDRVLSRNHGSPSPPSRPQRQLSCSPSRFWPNSIQKRSSNSKASPPVSRSRNRSPASPSPKRSRVEEKSSGARRGARSEYDERRSKYQRAEVMHGRRANSRSPTRIADKYLNRHKSATTSSQRKRTRDNSISPPLRRDRYSADHESQRRNPRNRSLSPSPSWIKRSREYRSDRTDSLRFSTGRSGVHTSHHAVGYLQRPLVLAARSRHPSPSRERHQKYRRLSEPTEEEANLPPPSESVHDEVIRHREHKQGEDHYKDFLVALGRGNADATSANVTLLARRQAQRERQVPFLMKVFVKANRLAPPGSGSEVNKSEAIETDGSKSFTTPATVKAREVESGMENSKAPRTAGENPSHLPSSEVDEDELYYTYVWMNSTLREVVNLIKDLVAEARDKCAFIKLSRVPFGEEQAEEMGELSSRYHRSIDRRTLRSCSFRIGDSILLSISSRRATSDYNASGGAHKGEDASAIHEESEAEDLRGSPTAMAS